MRTMVLILPLMLLGCVHLRRESPAPTPEPTPVISHDALAPITDDVEQTLPAPRSLPVVSPFKQPRLASLPQISLDQAIHLCLTRDPALRVAAEAIEQARAEFATSSLLPNPQLYLDYQLFPIGRSFNLQRQAGPPQSDLYLSWSIDWFLFGKRDAAMSNADAAISVAKAQYAEQVRQRVRDLMLTFYELAESQALLEQVDQDLENLRQSEKVTVQAVRNGGRPKIEENRIRLNVLNLEQAEREAKAVVIRNRAKLAAFLGHDHPRPAFDPSEDLRTSTTMRVPSIEEVMEHAIAHRPDLEAQRLQIRQLDAAVNVENTKAYPRVQPQIGWTRQYQESITGFPNANMYLISLTMDLPCFDQNQGGKAKANSLAAQSRWELQRRLVELRAEAETVIQDVVTSQANVRAISSDQLRLALEVRESLSKAYEAGTRPLIDLLDAQRDYRETYRNWISSRAAYLRAVQRLNFVMGTRLDR